MSHWRPHTLVPLCLLVFLVGGCGRAANGDGLFRTQKASVNLMVTSNISARGKSYWPFLQIQNLATGKVYELHRQEEPFEYTQSYRGRVPLGRYKLRSLYRERFPDEFFSPFNAELGAFDVNRDTDLGIVAHWLAEEKIWSSRYRPYTGKQLSSGWIKPVGQAQQQVNEKLSPLVEPLLWKKRR